MSKQNKRITLALVGYGYWAPRLHEAFRNMTDAQVRLVCTTNREHLRSVSRKYPLVPTTQIYKDVLADHAIDAVVIATPLSTHYDLARRALGAGKHVFLEKPMTQSVQTAQNLVALAQAKKKILLVDHTYLYDKALRVMKTYRERGLLGRVLSVRSRRANLGLFRQDCDVVWDLASHDISVCSFLLGEAPESVQAIGAAHVVVGKVDTALLVLRYGNARVFVDISWLSPDKERQIVLVGEKKMMVYNELLPRHQLMLYNTGVSQSRSKNVYVRYKRGGVVRVNIPKKESPLQSVCRDFLHCIKTGDEPRASGAVGVHIVRALEAASTSLASGGREVVV